MLLLRGCCRGGCRDSPAPGRHPPPYTVCARRPLAGRPTAGQAYAGAKYARYEGRGRRVRRASRSGTARVPCVRARCATEAAVRTRLLERVVSRQTTPAAMCGAILALVLPLVAEATSSPVIVGDTRVSALSPTLLRIEAKGPQGFENRQTFNVIGREAFGGVELKVLNKSSSGTWLAAPTYHVFVPAQDSPPPPGPAGSCDPQTFQENTDCAGPRRAGNYPNGAATSSPEACCALCSSDPECVAWTFHGGDGDGHCWPFSSCPGTRVNSGRTFGGAAASGPSSFDTSTIVTTPSGKLLWNGTNTGNSSKVAPNLLHWPSPLESASYAFMDSPRFTVPSWGPTPMPNVSTDLAPGHSVTNGYDFTNDKAGDIYVFIIGDTIEDWWASRAEFLTLTGPSPLLPDFTWGVWYTWYRQYSESQAKDEIGNWTKINLPLDSWGLDMNWRNVGFGEGAAPGDSASVLACHNQSNDDPRCRDHFYTHPNVEQLPGLGTSNEWFDYLKQQKLRTYLNDHPFPVDNQTTPKECTFRYAGLQEWIGRGLSYWWYVVSISNIRLNPLSLLTVTACAQVRSQLGFYPARPPHAMGYKGPIRGDVWSSLGQSRLLRIDEEGVRAARHYRSPDRTLQGQRAELEGTGSGRTVPSWSRLSCTSQISCVVDRRWCTIDGFGRLDGGRSRA